MRIYLDNCCYNRPYDDQTQIRISLEAQAKIFIQNAIKSGKIELATSFVLRHENDKNPFDDKRKTIGDFIENHTSAFVDADKKSEVKIIAEEIMRTGIKSTDSAHIACAILTDCDYFLTTDDRILKYRSDKIKILNPMKFLEILEVEKNVRDN